MLGIDATLDLPIIMIVTPLYFQKSISRSCKDTCYQDPCRFTSPHRPGARPSPLAQPRWVPSISPGRLFASFTQSSRAVQAAVAILTGQDVRIWKLLETDVDHSSMGPSIFFFPLAIFFLDGYLDYSQLSRPSISL